MNEVLEAIRTRRSIKKYKPDLPEQALIEQVAEAGTYAASGDERAVADHPCP